LRRIRWSPAAAADLEGIYNYLREHHPNFAHSRVRKIYDAARSLKKFPNRGRRGDTEGTRELVLIPLPYIIIYGIKHDVVDILRLIHASEDRP